MAGEISGLVLPCPVGAYEEASSPKWLQGVLCAINIYAIICCHKNPSSITVQKCIVILIHTKLVVYKNISHIYFSCLLMGE